MKLSRYIQRYLNYKGITPRIFSFEELVDLLNELLLYTQKDSYILIESLKRLEGEDRNHYIDFLDYIENQKYELAYLSFFKIRNQANLYIPPVFQEWESLTT